MVYAAYNKVGLAGQYLFQRYFHAVYGSTGACIDTVLNFSDADRAGGGDAASGTAAGTIGRYNNDVAEFAHYAGKKLYALCLITVVVCDKDGWSDFCCHLFLYFCSQR